MQKRFSQGNQYKVLFFKMKDVENKEMRLTLFIMHIAAMTCFDFFVFAHVFFMTLLHKWLQRTNNTYIYLIYGYIYKA